MRLASSNIRFRPSIFSAVMSLKMGESISTRLRKVIIGFKLSASSSVGRPLEMVVSLQKRPRCSTTSSPIRAVSRVPFPRMTRLSRWFEGEGEGEESGRYRNCTRSSTACDSMTDNGQATRSISGVPVSTPLNPVLRRAKCYSPGRQQWRIFAAIVHTKLPTGNATYDAVVANGT